MLRKTKPAAMIATILLAIALFFVAQTGQSATLAATAATPTLSALGGKTYTLVNGGELLPLK